MSHRLDLEFSPDIRSDLSRQRILCLSAGSESHADEIRLQVCEPVDSPEIARKSNFGRKMFFYRTFLLLIGVRLLYTFIAKDRAKERKEGIIYG